MCTQLISLRDSHFSKTWHSAFYYLYNNHDKVFTDDSFVDDDTSFFGFSPQLRMIGSGQFAQVYQSQNYAIKVIDKHRLSNQQINHVHLEKHILQSVTHPFLVRLWGSCQTSHSFLLAMDYVPGGELFKRIQAKKKLSEQEAKFYAAEVVLAIEYLHTQDIIYRDLKPENIMLDSQGHIKLIDFGFAKIVHDVTSTLCGTPDYLAPEIIKARGYTRAVDWWALGVLIYEMLVG
ncbi:unnamed protein product [Rhizopus stolonifer]